MNGRPRRGPVFVITNKAGQLGNRLFFSSYVLSLALKLDGKLINPGFIDFAADFAATERDVLARWPISRFECRSVSLGKLAFPLVSFLRRILIKLPFRFPGMLILGLHEDESANRQLKNEAFLKRLRSARWIWIEGWQHLEHITFPDPAPIRDFFTPASRHRIAVEKLIQSARQSCDILIGVHIRQGDYATFLSGRYYYETSVYLAQMKATAELFPEKRVSFFVCSNIRQTLSGSPAFGIIQGTGVVVEDLYALAACDYLIGPPSTFSWWASFYGEVPLREIRVPESVPKLQDFRVFCSGS